ncbi:DEAD/DEAH box helicase [Microvirga splendida]|uniref:DEAD/DEAH box helicase family protein n=1 Tax=Microvirga splendida TaxID=2795727 RepID=A0ABS0XXL3_9HYPH|nr:DEAD/DEAH box helicase family protein [Microvirga splendida]MBJ6124786.1 DEAD/DEAH box helicase family protein [Microvirga splendida]
MKLKAYQADTLATLRRFLEEARVAGPRNAYEAITSEPEQARRLGRYRGEYKALEALPDAPYVCLRLPTGGGKTVLGAHAIGIARDTWVEKDYPLVLWLVPSNTIRLQTAEALKNPRHPYRQALDEVFEGRVRVFDIADFTQVRPHDIRDNLCVVVGTIQTLRVNNTEGRKVYAHHEDMEPHFSGVSAHAPELERQEGGGVRYSFANLLHMHRPLMIVDEAHNAVTGLSREMQARVNPCAIIEFTATPRFNSNILHSVTAQELRDEEMIKLPIVLAEHQDWQGAVNGAIATRAKLAEAAKDEADYIRPIVLFQAQPKDQEVTVERLKQHLIDVEQIPEGRIAVATGEQRELDGIDLFDQKTKIEYVITVEALKEGWDCSFAYVFCSVSRIQSATAVEQLLGRVLRMPYAKRRRIADLNKAYAHISEPTFSAAANALVDKLVSMGFQDEAPEMIEAAQGHFDETGLFAPRERPKPTFRYSVTPSPALYAAVRDATVQGVAVNELPEGKVEIVVTGPIAAEVETILTEAMPEPERQRFAEAARAYQAEILPMLSPAERGEAFTVPGLVSEIQGELVFAAPETLMEFHDWSLLNHPAKLDEAAFSIRDNAQTFEIDVDGRCVIYSFAQEDRQLSLDIAVEGWTPENLSIWLERQLRQPDIHPFELLRWVRDAVGHLTNARKISVASLMRAKFILASALKTRIAAIRRIEQETAYRRYLIAPEAKACMSLENGFAFRNGMFADQRRYRGAWRPTKHFLGPDHVPAFDGAEQGEEFQCAQVLDSLPSVRYWIRNVAKHPDAFWLPLASGKFYPDFVALLNDGRLFVIEYKGAHLAGEGNEETNEKRTVGQLWDRLSDGKGLFLMVEKSIHGRDMRTQMMGKLGI